jgi:signal transduction histidine kinase
MDLVRLVPQAGDIGGAGCGLAMVRDIHRAHREWILLGSTPGQRPRVTPARPRR